MILVANSAGTHPVHCSVHGVAALVVLSALCSCASGTGARPKAFTRPGIEVLKERRFDALRGKRVGLITNQSAVDSNLRHTADLLADQSDVRLIALFAPEHGVRGTAQAGEGVEDSVDWSTGVPVYSLYRKTGDKRRKPLSGQVDGLDVLVYDIQDVGARTYTYLTTLRYAMEAAAESGVELWVLDRPNPLGGEVVEGPMLETDFESFVGPHPLPIRYGMTVGEYALMIRSERSIDVTLEVVPIADWSREEVFSGGRGTWVAPSPNIPTPETALAYSGFVLLEGTNLSEGRGTTRPFLLFGAPWLRAESIVDRLNALQLPGVRFRTTGFVPSFARCADSPEGKKSGGGTKFAGETCQAVALHITDLHAFRPVRAAVAAITIVRELHPAELEIDAARFDKLAGTTKLREAIERGDSVADIVLSWHDALSEFRARRQAYLIYGRTSAGSRTRLLSSSDFDLGSGSAGR